MHLDNFKKVEKLVRIKANCELALESLEVFIFNAHDQGCDPGGEEEFNIGYNAAFSRHSDGSGDQVDMSGCYVGVEAAEAIQVVLNNQLAHVRAALNTLGVDYTD